jgi:hypothetical protein
MFKYLISEGYNVTIVTRHWTEKYNGWEDAMKFDEREIEYTKRENGEIIRLPYVLSKKKINNRFFSKLYVFYKFLVGDLQFEIDTYKSFYPFLKQYLANNYFDFIIVTAPPNNIIKLGSKLAKEFNVKLIVDFRDFFNDIVFNKNYKFNFNLSVLYYLSIFHMRKWIKNASFFISVSEPYTKKVSTILKHKGYTITNGYDDELFKSITITPNKLFIIRYIGSCHDLQDFSIILKALIEFTKLKNNVLIELIGLQNEKVIKQFKSFISDNQLSVITERIDREKVISITANSDVLFFPCPKDYIGIYGTKIFEYIASGSFVLVSPGDDGVVSELINETQGGIIANDAKEAFEVLCSQYEKWLIGSNKQISNSEILNYSRANTIKNLANILKNYHEA